MNPVSKSLATGTLVAVVLFTVTGNRRPHQVELLQPNDYSDEASTGLHLKNAGVLLHKQVAFSGKVHVSKPAKKINRTGLAINCEKNISSGNDATVFWGNDREDSIAQPQRTGGTAYHAGGPRKMDTEKNAAISAFASIKQADNGAASYSYASIYDGTEALKEFAIQNGDNTDYAMMVDLGLKSGKKRFFVVDLSSNTIVKRGVVAESANGSFTSLGVFAIGQHTIKSAYKLRDIQETTLTKRPMLLQATDDVPDDEINFPVLKTNRALSLSSSFFAEVSVLIDGSAKPVLLWVYDSSAENEPLYSAVRK